jgi:hypothetical protein
MSGGGGADTVVPSKIAKARAQYEKGNEYHPQNSAENIIIHGSHALSHTQNGHHAPN